MWGDFHFFLSPKCGVVVPKYARTLAPSNLVGYVGAFLRVVVSRRVVVFVRSSKFFGHSSRAPISRVRDLYSTACRAILGLLREQQACGCRRYVQGLLASLRNALSLSLGSRVFPYKGLLLCVFTKYTVVVLRVLYVLSRSIFPSRLFGFFFYTRRVDLSILLT